MGIAKKLHMLVTKYLYTISFYLEACESSDYNPLSKSSLWRILASIKPSGRKHLGGFDNLTASGINRFETLLKLVSKQGIEKTTTKTIQNGKRYLKTNYQMHCNTISYSQSKTHSFIFFIWCKQDMLKSETFNDSSDDFRKLIEAIYKIQSIIKYNENLMLFVIVILP